MRTKALTRHKAKAFMKTTANAFCNPPRKRTEGAKVAQTDEGWLDRQQCLLGSAAELDRSMHSSQQALHHRKLRKTAAEQNK
jgi:hypothetical protein